MEQSVISSSINTYGFIGTINNIGNSRIKNQARNSVEDYVGKITAVFLPYVSQNISDGKFISIQNDIKRIISEIKEGE